MGDAMYSVNDGLAPIRCIVMTAKLCTSWLRQTKPSVRGSYGTTHRCRRKKSGRNNVWKWWPPADANYL